MACALTGPMPGRASSSSLLAALMLNLLAGRQLCGRDGGLAAFSAFISLAGFVSETGLAGATVAAAFAGAAEPTVTRGFYGFDLFGRKP